MDYDEVRSLDGVPDPAPKSTDYRTWSVCGGDCEPDMDFASDKQGTRIAFVCPNTGYCRWSTRSKGSTDARASEAPDKLTEDT